MYHKPRRTIYIGSTLHMYLAYFSISTSFTSSFAHSDTSTTRFRPATPTQRIYPPLTLVLYHLNLPTNVVAQLYIGTSYTFSIALIYPTSCTLLFLHSSSSPHFLTSASPRPLIVSLAVLSANPPTVFLLSHPSISRNRNNYLVDCDGMHLIVVLSLSHFLLSLPEFLMYLNLLEPNSELKI
jgi:hypothetical protein